MDNEESIRVSEEVNEEEVQEGQEENTAEDGEQPSIVAKPKKKHVLLKILLPIGAILVIAAVLAALFGKKTIQYFDAKEKMAVHDYKASYEIYESLNGFLDSQEKAKEGKYQYALKMFAKGDYSQAKTLFSSLGDYQDAASYISKCNIRKDEISPILELLYAGKYSEAKSKISALSNSNKDKNYLTSLVKYLLADKELKASNYEQAISDFSAISSFADAKAKISEAKYKYVTKGSYYVDEWTVYEYLKDLVSENYPGAKAKYDQLYTKKVDMYYNTTSDGTDRQTSLSRWKPVYCHIVFSGCTPDEEVQLCWYTLYSDGRREENSKFNFKNGNADWLYVYWKDGPQGSCSWATIVVFIEGGPELGRATINLY